MKVLLISPLDPIVPSDLKFLMGGENTYTRMLLSQKLKGVQFVHVEDALEQGLVSYGALHYLFLILQRLRILSPGPRVYVLDLHESFDLVYTHVYPVKISERDQPLVISDSSSNIVFLEKYVKWSKFQIQIAQIIKRLVFKLFGIVDSEVNHQSSHNMFVFSAWAKRIKKVEFEIDNCEVIYPGLPIPKFHKRKVRSGRDLKILFVGVWFERKGGRLTLEAFIQLQKKYPRIKLTIFGHLPHDVSIDRNNSIIQKDFVSYEKLLTAYQTHDVLVSVPPEVEGYGMAVTEAMSYWVVPVVSNVCVLPEFVEHTKSGLVVQAGSVEDLV